MKELLERRARVWADMRSIVDGAKERGDGITAEERGRYDGLEGELNELTAQIDLAERDKRSAERMAAVTEDRAVELSGLPKDQRTAVERYEEAFDHFMRDGMADLEAEERQILRNAGELTAKELRAQGVATGGAGGFTVPEGFLRKITETQKVFGGMLGVANVIDTETGNALPWPGNDDTGNVGAILGENTQITEQDVTWTAKTLQAYMYTSKLVRVSYQLLQDSAFDQEAFLGRKFGERLGRIHNQHFTTGTGTSQPQGIVTGTSTGKTTASATAIDWAELVDLQHSVDIAYRSNGRFMLHDLVLAHIRKLEDANGLPLWNPSVREGAPDTILGAPYTVNNDMASTVATGNTTVLYGDFNSAYIVRRVRGIQVVRLAERYADFLQVGFFAFDRMDGMVDDAAAVKKLVQA